MSERPSFWRTWGPYLFCIVFTTAFCTIIHEKLEKMMGRMNSGRFKETEQLRRDVDELKKAIQPSI